jgi:homoserine/homoserine lactone efflux protein
VLAAIAAQSAAMNGQLFTAYLIIATLLILTPGPVVTLVLATAAAKGTRAGLVTVAGTSSGSAVLLLAIGTGLSWVVSNATLLFEMLRWAGAAYLIWLGIQSWRGAGRADAATATPPRRPLLFGRGFLVALTNPKAIAFFTAFLPQFVDPTLPAERQLAVMCASFVVIAALADSAWAIAAGLGRGWFLKGSRARLLARLSGVTLIGGGIWLTLARRTS